MIIENPLFICDMCDELDKLTGMPSFTCDMCNKKTSQGCNLISCEARSQAKSNYLKSGRLTDFPTEI